MLVRFAINKKLGGFVVDGSVRDLDALKNFPIPVYAKGVSPNGPYKDGTGNINVPVSIGGKVVNPGDILVGDLDGVVVFPNTKIEETISLTKQTEEKEEEIIKDLEKGINFDTKFAFDKLK